MPKQCWRDCYFVLFHGFFISPPIWDTIVKFCCWNKRYFSKMCLFSYLLGICDDFCMRKNRQRGDLTFQKQPVPATSTLLCCCSSAGWGQIQTPWSCSPPTSKLGIRELSKSHMEIFVASSLAALSVQNSWIMVKNIVCAELIQFWVQTISLRLNLFLAVTASWCDLKLGAELDKRFAGRKREGCELDA